MVTAVAEKCSSVWIIFCEIFEIYFTPNEQTKKMIRNADCVMRAVLILTQQKIYCFKTEPKHMSFRQRREKTSNAFIPLAGSKGRR